MRGTSQSAPKHSILLGKPPTVNIKKNLITPKLGPKNTVSVIAFRIAWTLDVKIVWFSRQVAVCVQKQPKNTIFGCSWFQKFNFDGLLLKLPICSLKTENIFNTTHPLWAQSSSIISGTFLYSTLFLASSHKSWR